MSARHRDEHLAEALGLLVLLAGEVDAAELRDAVDEERDLRAEELGELLGGRVGVLDHVVQERRADARRVEPHVGDDVRDRRRMDEVRVARLPHLAVVRLGRVHVGLVDQIDIGARVVTRDLLHDVGEADHRTQRPSPNGGGLQREIGAFLGAARTSALLLCKDWAGTVSPEFRGNKRSAKEVDRSLAPDPGRIDAATCRESGEDMGDRAIPRSRPRPGQGARRSTSVPCPDPGRALRRPGGEDHERGFSEVNSGAQVFPAP